MVLRIAPPLSRAMSSSGGDAVSNSSTASKNDTTVINSVTCIKHENDGVQGVGTIDNDGTIAYLFRKERSEEPFMVLATDAPQGFVPEGAPRHDVPEEIRIEQGALAK